MRLFDQFSFSFLFLSYLLLAAKNGAAFPPLYRIIPQNRVSCSYLLGTLHQLGVDSLPNRLTNLIPYSRVLLVERIVNREPTDKKQAFEVLRALAPGWAWMPSKKLSELISPDAISYYDQRLSPIYPDKSWLGLHPYFVIAIMVPLLNQIENTSGATMESGLVTLARKSRVVVQPIELIDDIRSSLNEIHADIPPPDQLAPILEAIALGPMFGVVHTLANFNHEVTYLYGDMERWQQEQERGYPPFDAPYEAAVLTSRNRKWIGRIQTEVQRGNAFIAVGHSHLWNVEGLLQMIKDNGNQVEKITGENALPNPVFGPWIRHFKFWAN